MNLSSGYTKICYCVFVMTALLGIHKDTLMHTRTFERELLFVIDRGKLKRHLVFPKCPEQCAGFC
jgi:hypothetical protein